MLLTFSEREEVSLFFLFTVHCTGFVEFVSLWHPCLAWLLPCAQWMIHHCARRKTPFFFFFSFPMNNIAEHVFYFFFFCILGNCCCIENLPNGARLRKSWISPRCVLAVSHCRSHSALCQAGAAHIGCSPVEASYMQCSPIESCHSGSPLPWALYLSCVECVCVCQCCSIWRVARCPSFIFL